MSMRTIVELNHDFADNVGSCDYLAELLAIAMRTNSSDEWEALERLGVRKIVTTHHSAERKVVIDEREYRVS